MALSARTRSVMDIIALVVLTVSPLSLLYFMPVRIPTRTLSLPEAQLRCLKGKCFLLGQETKILMKLPLLVPVRGFFRDKVLTLGTNSELEIIFPDKSKLLQRNTSLLEIQKGRGALLRELEKDPAGGSSEKDPSKKQQLPQSIIYVGNLPIEILYPLADTDVIPISFPARLNVTFRIAPQLTSLDASQANAFSTWTLHVITQNEAPRPIKDFIFTETQIPRHFSSTIVIDEPGYYLLTPKGLDPSQSFNGFKMRVSDRKDLGTKINQMLDDYDHSQDKPLEIRQE